MSGNANSIKNIKNLVLCGGGIKGIAHIGALYALDTLKYLNKIKEFAGTSVGGLIITLYVLGYSPAELYDFIKLFDLKKLKNISIFNIHLFGLDVGSKFEYTIKRLIKCKGHSENITMKELYDKTNLKITLVTVCLNTMEICHISHETFPELEVYLAIRMTTSIPFIYTPVIYNNRLYVDGGCMDDYPISIFKNELSETIGLLIINSQNKIDKIDNLETYTLRVLECMMVGLACKLNKGYESNTIEIHVENINFINYDINDETKDLLFIQGFKSIIEKLAINNQKTETI